MTLEDRVTDVDGQVRDATEAERKEAGIRPTGQEHFDSLSPSEQDELIGPEAAEKIRKGEATLSDFVESAGGFIRQRPASDV